MFFKMASDGRDWGTGGLGNRGIGFLVPLDRETLCVICGGGGQA